MHLLEKSNSLITLPINVYFNKCTLQILNYFNKLNKELNHFHYSPKKKKDYSYS